MKKSIQFLVGPHGPRDTLLAGEIREDNEIVMTISFQIPSKRPSPEAFQMLVNRMRIHAEEANK